MKIKSSSLEKQSKRVFFFKMDSENTYRQRYEQPPRRSLSAYEPSSYYDSSYQVVEEGDSSAYRRQRQSTPQHPSQRHTENMMRVQAAHGNRVGDLIGSSGRGGGRGGGGRAPAAPQRQASQHWSGAQDSFYNQHQQREKLPQRKTVIGAKQSTHHPPTASQSTMLVREDEDAILNAIRGGGFAAEVEAEMEADPFVPGLPFQQQVVYNPRESPEERPSNPDANEDYSVVLEHDERGRVGHSGQAFPHVFSDKPFLQMPQMNLILNPVPAYLTLDSRDRDRTVWPNSNHYRVPLVSSSNDLNVKSPNVVYKNIYSISLLSAVVPNTGNVFDEPYLLLQIDEIDNMYDAASTACAKAFTKIYFKEVCPLSRYLRMDKGVGDPLTKIYWPAPRASLQSITLSFRRHNGELIDFGADNMLPDEPRSDLQTSITLEIRTFVTDSGSALGHRNP